VRLMPQRCYFLDLKMGLYIISTFRTEAVPANLLAVSLSLYLFDNFIVDSKLTLLINTLQVFSKTALVWTNT
jgi:hypothetical protein